MSSQGERKTGFDWIPSCYKSRQDGLCKGLWSNDYWSYKKCRYCPFFPIEWCGTCKYMEFHGPHMTCNNRNIFGGKQKWIKRSDCAWITRKKDVEQNPKHGCQHYERR